MLRYKLGEVARLSGRSRFGFKRTVLKAPEASVGAERGHLKAQKDMLRGIATEVQRLILPNYVPGIPIDAPVNDAMADSFWEMLSAVKDRLVGVATTTVNRILRLEGQRHTNQFNDIAKRSLGVDLRGAVKNSDLEQYLEQAALRNANLIKGLADATIQRIKERTIAATLNGESHAVLWKKLQAEFDLSEKRAKLIARDQIGKLTGDLNRLRQEQAGIDRYVWSTSLDERVRPLHRDLEGQEYKWGEETGAEEGLPPGQPIQCRCIAKPIVEF